ncbi:MAG: 3-phosphoserine/phosphohydroxythreonine transaminase [Flavobacteriales bacterium]|nr:3-phosphoserine/phosphohydroxythreonine transaminase [Flavobacteriales bacterium]|tara:strand:- start:216 stop:1280 length:1065 start_codon:yes stop_codon:yes gene_type:complete
MKKHNFSAGPCVLPKSVLDKCSKSILEFNKLGLSLIEISHRSKDFIEVMEKARLLTKELLKIPKGYSILFLQGGASLEFLMVPANLLKHKAAYLKTGTWANKAINEAELYGEVNIVGDSSDTNYSYIPKGYHIPKDIDYFHCTSNNTIFGTQIHEFPEVPSLMVCDMSSDIFSREINIDRFDLIYAGAQKNMGPAGTTLVIVKDEILGKTNRKIPTMLDYQTHIKKESMFNTPPVFAVYASMLTLEWLKNKGGIKEIEKINRLKSETLYTEIDRNSLFNGISNIEDRSIMNVTFDTTRKDINIMFDQLCDKAGIYGIKGHRSVGGYRASIYNALSIDSVNHLVEIMQDLEIKMK